MNARPFAVEHRRLAPRYAVRADGRAQLRVVIATMRNVPRESTESMPDMFHLLRRLAGTLAAIEVELQPVEQQPARVVRRPAGATSAAEVVFGKSRAPAREQRREIVSRKGARVRVIERRSAGQIEMGF